MASRVNRIVVGFACLAILGSVRSVEAQVANARLLLESGESKFIKGDTAGAIADLTKAIALDPALEDAYTYRSIARGQQGDREGALADVEQAITLNPANGVNYGLRGALRDEKGDHAGAVSDFTQAAKGWEAEADALANSTNPADRQSRRVLLVYLRLMYGAGRLNDPAKMESVLQKLIEGEPAGTADYFDLAELYEDRRAYDAAEETLLRGERANPADPYVPTQLAAFYQRRGTLQKGIQAADLQKGIQAADRALGIQPENVDALVYKGLLLRLQALLETDRRKQVDLITQAQALEAKAKQLRPAGAPPPPPTPPLPPGYLK